MRQVGNGNAEIMVGIHQSHAPGDNTVPVKVGVITEADVKILLHRYQPGHGIRGGTIHPDLAVLVAVHKGKG